MPSDRYYNRIYMKEFFRKENLSMPVDLIRLTDLKRLRIVINIINFIEKHNKKQNKELGVRFQMGILEVIKRCEVIIQQSIQQQRQDRGDWLPFDSPDEDMREHWKEMPLQCPYIININD